VSRFLALDLEQGQLYLAAAHVKGLAVKVEQALVLPEAGALTAGNAAVLGERLKDLLKEAGIAPAPLLVSIGRERVILKEVKYPAGVGAAEEPALVRFQVSKELAEGADSVVIDYFALPTLDPDGQRRALAFAIRKDLLAPLRALAAAASLKLAGITPRPFGIAAALMRAVKDGAVTPPDSLNAPLAILVRGDKWGELVILRGGQVAFTRSLTGMALGSETAMLGELRRNLAVFAGSSQQNAVQALYVAEGDLAGGWSGRLRAGLSIPVQAFDPVAGAGVETQASPETRGCFAGAVGLAALRARSAELPINFLEPREPRPVSDPGKRLIGLVGAAAAVLVVGGLIAGLVIADQKKNAVAALLTQKLQLEEDLRNMEDGGKRVKAVREWEDKGVNWLDELYDLTYRFPDPANTEVRTLVCGPLEPAKGSKLKYVADMRLDIFTDAVKDVDMLATHMSQDHHYSVSPKISYGPTQGFRSLRKNQKFVFRATVEHRDPVPSQYTLKLTTIPPLEPRGRRDRANGRRPEDAGMLDPFDVLGGLQ
jgi:hypothetical protein